MILVTKWFGAFLCDDGKVIRSSLFPKDPVAIAQRLDVMRRGGILAEEQKLAGQAQKVVDKRLAEFGRTTKFDSSFIKPEDHGFTIAMYREATIVLAKQAVKASVGPDQHLGQAVRAHDDLVFASNLLAERLREWYGLHFPEFEVVVTTEAFVRAILEHGSRDKILEALKLEMDSIGGDIEPEDLEAVRQHARPLLEMLVSREKLERYIESRMKHVAPNVAAIAGPVIGARMIMQAGSLMRLAKMPSGTVQLLGAEKAMFRHLKKGSRPPKHGTLFQHPLVHSAPLWQRGSIARAIAGKICLAARADAYTKNDISELLKDQLDKRVVEIKRQHANPPKRRQESRPEGRRFDDRGRRPDRRPGGRDRRGRGPQGF